MSDRRETIEPTAAPTAELPAAGDSTPAARTDPRRPDASGSLLTIQEAAQRFDVSVATLRRRIEPGGGGIEGAHKVPGPKGERWMLPIAALVSMGYADRLAESSEQAEQALNNEVIIELKASRELLEQLYRAERARLEAAEEHRVGAEQRASEMAVKVAEMSAELAAARTRSEMLAAELERARQPRGIFRRRPR